MFSTDLPACVNEGHENDWKHSVLSVFDTPRKKVSADSSSFANHTCSTLKILGLRAGDRLQLLSGNVIRYRDIYTQHRFISSLVFTAKRKMILSLSLSNPSIIVWIRNVLERQELLSMLPR
jgi:hypothetical protein